MSSPTQRTLAYLRDLGYEATVCEYWNSFTRQRKDLYGFGDIIAFRDDETLLVQATSTGNMRARVNKIREIDQAWLWMGSPYRSLWVMGWKKYAKRVENKLWRETIIDVKEEFDIRN